MSSNNTTLEEMVDIARFVKDNGKTIDGDAYSASIHNLRLAVEGYLDKDESKMQSAMMATVVMSFLDLLPNSEHMTIMFGSTLKYYPKILNKNIDDEIELSKNLDNIKIECREYFKNAINTIHRTIRDEYGNTVDGGDNDGIDK